MTDTHMTPKDFAPHLLGVLATLTEYEANISVPMEETYKPVCQSMGISEDHGGMTSGGHVFTHRNISLAFRQHLRGKGLGEQVKRGHWMLTEEGVNQAREEREERDDKTVLTSELASEPESSSPVSEVFPEVESLPEPIKEEPLQAARSNAGVKLEDMEEGIVLQLPVVKHSYSDDPYIRSLAIESVPCFGAWSSRSDDCQGCPLTTDCKVQIGVRKAEMAAEIEAKTAADLERAEAQAKEAAKQGMSVEELIEKVSAENASSGDAPKGKFKPVGNQDFASAFASRESVCLQCGEAIPKGSPMKWCADEGIFHVECFDDSDQ